MRPPGARGPVRRAVPAGGQAVRYGGPSRARSGPGGTGRAPRPGRRRGTGGRPPRAPAGRAAAPGSPGRRRSRRRSTRPGTGRPAARAG
nr:MAG: hypothetical protein DIU60_03210 [Actinomycetota bacterium]